MTFRTIVVLFAVTVFIILGLVNGCRDTGSEPPPSPEITKVEPDSGAVGDTIKIEGRNFGDSRGRSEVRFGSVAATQDKEWRNDQIKVRVPSGATTGLIKVVVGGQESNGVNFQIFSSPGMFGVGQKNVNLLVGDSLAQTISGGTPPYLIVSEVDTTKVKATIFGSTLLLRARSAGLSTVIIGDSRIVQSLDTIRVTVAALVSFASSIQLIFNNNCLGCHTPGGIGPFSLQSDTSYGSLVNVNEQASPACSGKKRVLPGNATESVLYLRVFGSTCGSRMPQGGSALPSASINLIRDWINQGAQP